MDTLEIDGVRFVLDNRVGPLREKSDSDKIVLVKTRRILEFYESLRERAPKNILEIGMSEGGSLIYFDKLYSPDKLVGIDLRRAPIPALELYKETRPHIKTFYGRAPICRQPAVPLSQIFRMGSTWWSMTPRIFTPRRERRL